MLESCINKYEEGGDIQLGAIIYRFGTTYTHATKSLRRVLEVAWDSYEEIDQLMFENLVRFAAEKGIIDDPVRWFKYRDLYNNRNQVDDEEHLKTTYPSAKLLLEDTKNLLEKLEGLIASSITYPTASALVKTLHQISEEDKKTVMLILEANAPDCDILAYGSRVTGINLKKFSDLDLAVASCSKDKKIMEQTLSNLREAFSTSNLPFRVDITLWNDLAEDFRCLIENDLLEIQEAML